MIKYKYQGYNNIPFISQGVPMCPENHSSAVEKVERVITPSKL